MKTKKTNFTANEIQNSKVSDLLFCISDGNIDCPNPIKDKSGYIKYCLEYGKVLTAFDFQNFSNGKFTLIDFEIRKDQEIVLCHNHEVESIAAYYSICY